MSGKRTKNSETQPRQKHGDWTHDIADDFRGQLGPSSKFLQAHATAVQDGPDVKDTESACWASRVRSQV